MVLKEYTHPMTNRSEILFDDYDVVAFGCLYKIYNVLHCLQSIKKIVKLLTLDSEERKDF
jgi:hypothetical protein